MNTVLLELPAFGSIVVTRAALALGVGLGDTWVDWRNRARPRDPTRTTAA